MENFNFVAFRKLKYEFRDLDGVENEHLFEVFKTKIFQKLNVVFP